MTFFHSLDHRVQFIHCLEAMGQQNRILQVQVIQGGEWLHYSYSHSYSFVVLHRIALFCSSHKTISNLRLPAVQPSNHLLYWYHKPKIHAAPRTNSTPYSILDCIANRLGRRARRQTTWRQLPLRNMQKGEGVLTTWQIVLEFIAIFAIGRSHNS